MLILGEIYPNATIIDKVSDNQDITPVSSCLCESWYTDDESVYSAVFSETLMHDDNESGENNIFVSQVSKYNFVTEYRGSQLKVQMSITFISGCMCSTKKH